ncbi:MAG: ABC transporter substrate-binding protein [Nitrososphaerales archaeon]
MQRSTIIATIIVIIVIIAAASAVILTPPTTITSTVTKVETTTETRTVTSTMTAGTATVTLTQTVAQTTTVTQPPLTTTVTQTAAPLTTTVTVTATPKVEPIKLKIGTLTFPAYMSIVHLVIENQSFDKKNGLDVEWVRYSAIAAAYAGLGTGEAHIWGGGANVFQRMHNEGIPITIISTYATATLYIVARDPNINSIKDLAGKTLAIDVGAVDYQLVGSYALTQGLKLGEQITVRAAAYPVARAEFEAKRVDAAVLVEPHVALAKKADPATKVIWVGNEAWRELKGYDYAWYLLLAMNNNYLKQNPQSIPRIIAMYKDAEDFIRDNPDKADQIVTKALNLPRGVIKEGILTGRIDPRFRAVWDPAVKENVWALFQFGVDSGFIDKMPAPTILYSP